jgi:hypothetical protein
MTNLFERWNVGVQTNLSSRPERSEVEGPAVRFTGNEGWVPHSSLVFGLSGIRSTRPALFFH